MNQTKQAPLCTSVLRPMSRDVQSEGLSLSASQTVSGPKFNFENFGIF
jgi:hypothetical protein